MPRKRHSTPYEHLSNKLPTAALVEKALLSDGVAHHCDYALSDDVPLLQIVVVGPSAAHWLELIESYHAQMNRDGYQSQEEKGGSSADVQP